MGSVRYHTMDSDEATREQLMGPLENVVSGGPMSPPETTTVDVIAVTQSDPFFTGRFFETFLRDCEHLPVRVMEIVLLPNFNESRFALARRLLRFYGPVDLARLAARYVATRMTGRSGSPHSVEAVAASHSIPVRRCSDINDEESVRAIRERNPHVLLSVAAPQIFREPLLAAAPTVLNVHSGLLPRYRGMMPTFWAMQNAEREVVVTVHEMVKRLDAGDVIAEFPVPIDPDESAFDVSAKAKAVAGREVARLLATMRDGPLEPIRSPDMSAQRYYGFPTRQDAKRLRAMGRALL